MVIISKYGSRSLHGEGTWCFSRLCVCVACVHAQITKCWMESLESKGSETVIAVLCFFWRFAVNTICSSQMHYLIFKNETKRLGCTHLWIPSNSIKSKMTTFNSLYTAQLSSLHLPAIGPGRIVRNDLWWSSEYKECCSSIAKDKINHLPFP